MPTERTINTGIFVLLCVIAGLLGYLAIPEPPEPEPETGAVAMVRNDYGFRTPVVEALPPEGASVPALSRALEGDRSGDLSRYVRAYLYYANDLVMRDRLVTADETVRFQVDPLDNRLFELEWRDRYPTGIEYEGGALVDSRRLHEMAYGILLEWTGGGDWRESLRRFHGDLSEKPALDFQRALFHIHRGLLTEIYATDAERRIELEGLPSLTEADDLIARLGHRDAWRAIDERFSEDATRVLEYIDRGDERRGLGFAPDSWVVLTYYLGPLALEHAALNEYVGVEGERSLSEEQLLELREEREREEAERREAERREAEREERRERAGPGLRMPDSEDPLGGDLRNGRR